MSRVWWLIAALTSFDRFVRQHHLPDLPRVELPGFDGAPYAISSRILSGPEYEAALSAIQTGDLVVADETARDELITYSGLAFRVAMRRTEMLGLETDDVSAASIQIRHNELRGLKTTNAYRRVPLAALDKVASASLDRLRSAQGPHGPLFFKHPPQRSDFDSAPVIGQAKLLLKRVTGDAELHAPNLRHSAATLASWPFGSIFDGDILVVDRSLQASPGKVVVAAYDGDLYVKRLRSIRGRLALVSENAARSAEFPHLYLDKAQECTLWGVVTGLARTF